MWDSKKKGLARKGKTKFQNKRKYQTKEHKPEDMSPEEEQSVAPNRTQSLWREPKMQAN